MPVDRNSRTGARIPPAEKCARLVNTNDRYAPLDHESHTRQEFEKARMRKIVKMPTVVESLVARGLRKSTAHHAAEEVFQVACFTVVTTSRPPDASTR
jgi:hypothetical protein